MDSLYHLTTRAKDGAGYQSRTGDWTLATFRFTPKLILQIDPGFTPGVPHVVVTAALHLVIAHGCQHFL